MRILVTGGAGYIGSVVSTYLIDMGHDVTVLDNLSRGFREAVPSNARFIQSGIEDILQHITPEDGVEAVVHLAAFAYVGESVEYPEMYWKNNVIGSLRLLDGIRDLGIKKLVFASTCATYGEVEKLPITEEQPTKPVNAYGMTKLAIDMAITTESKAHGLSAVSLRFFNVAGAYGKAGERHIPETHIIPNAFNAAVDASTFSLFGSDYKTKDGTCVRDYVHVVDLARAIELSLTGMRIGEHSIYNLGSGTGFSNKEVISVVEEVTNKPIKLTLCPRRDGDPAELVATSKKIQAELGWRPQYPTLKKMIQDAWEFRCSS